MIDLIKESIRKAELEESKLDSVCFTAPGFTSPKIRHLLNNVCSYEFGHYLEIGVHKGATFVAANYGNNLLSSIAVDNWSEFAECGEAKKEFYKHSGRLLNSYKVYEQDCFTIGSSELLNPVNIYLYDGCHSEESHVRSLTHFYPYLAEEFIFMVDDWNWPYPKSGTRNAISELGLKVKYERELDDGWWNGFYICLLSK